MTIDQPSAMSAVPFEERRRRSRIFKLKHKPATIISAGDMRARTSHMMRPGEGLEPFIRRMKIEFVELDDRLQRRECLAPEEVDVLLDRLEARAPLALASDETWKSYAVPLAQTSQEDARPEAYVSLLPEDVDVQLFIDRVTELQQTYRPAASEVATDYPTVEAAMAALRAEVKRLPQER